MNRFPSSITLRQLQYFLAAAETLHFTKAAGHMSVTQPTLSHQIAQLEAQLGGPLFDRVGKTVRLTESGALLKSYADRAVKELEAGRFALSELEGMIRGELRIGVIQSFSRTLLPSILGSFIQLYPGIRMNIQEMPGLAIEQALASGLLDLGIGFAPATMEATEVEPVLEEQLLLVVGSNHKFAKRTSLQFDQLDNEPMILLGKEYSTRNLIESYFATANIRSNVMYETNSIEVMLGAIAESKIATIIPESGLRKKSGRHRAVSLRNPTPVRTSALLWPRHSFRSASARTFGKMMRDRFLSAIDN